VALNKRGEVLSEMRFEDAWGLVVSVQGERFETKTGKPFTYEVRGNIVNLVDPGRRKYNLSRLDFERVVDIGPLDGPGPIVDLVRGSAYIWAILHDPRVRGVAWPGHFG
jgi:hypothetical protein